MIHCYSLIVFILTCQFLSAQSIEKLSSEQLKQDFQFLIQSIQQHNPTLGQYNSLGPIKQSWDSLASQIKAPLSALQYHQILARAVALINEGHLILGDKEAPFFSGFFNEEFKILPLEVRWINQRLFVWRNYSPDSSLSKGAEILTINDKSPSDIQSLVFPYISADGHIQTYKDHIFAKEFAANYFWFVEQASNFRIKYRTAYSEKVQKQTLAAISRPQMSKWSIKKGFQKETALGINQIYSWYQNEAIAVLRLRDFDAANCSKYQIEANSLYEKIFKRLRENKVQHLIIDLRDNKGGLKEFADELMAYTLLKNKKGCYRTLSNADGQVLHSFFPKRNRWYFKGSIYVLVNGATFSTAALMAQYLKAYSNAIIIGEETGSRYEGFAAGTYHYCRLPHSTILVGIPNKWVQNQLVSSPKQKNRGLIPDYPIQLSIKALLRKKDLALEKAYDLISNP